MDADKSQNIKLRTGRGNRAGRDAITMVIHSQQADYGSAHENGDQ